MAQERKPKSPYQKYGKAPFVYSPAYQLWREAVLKDGAGSQRALALACAHAKHMRVVNEVCEA